MKQIESSSNKKYEWRTSSVKGRMKAMGMYNYEPKTSLLSDFCFFKKSLNSTDLRFHSSCNQNSIRNKSVYNFELDAKLLFSFIIKESHKVSNALLSLEEYDETNQWLNDFLQHAYSVQNTFFVTSIKANRQGETIKKSLNLLRSFLEFLKLRAVEYSSKTLLNLSEFVARCEIALSQLKPLRRSNGYQLSREKGMREACSVYSQSRKFSWVDLMERYEALWTGFENKGVDGVRHILKKSDFDLQDALIVQNYLICYIIYVRGHRPGIFRSLTVAHVQNWLTASEDHYKYIAITQTKNAARGNVEWLLIDDKAAKVFQFYSDKLRSFLAPQNVSLPKTNGCHACQITVDLPSKKSNPKSQKVHQTTSHLFFVNNSCKPIQNCSEYLCRFLKKSFDFDHISANQSRHIHQTSSKTLSTLGLISRSVYESYSKSQNHTPETAETFYTEANTKVSEMIKSVKLIRVALNRNKHSLGFSKTRTLPDRKSPISGEARHTSKELEGSETKEILQWQNVNTSWLEYKNTASASKRCIDMKEKRAPKTENDLIFKGRNFCTKTLSKKLKSTWETYLKLEKTARIREQWLKKYNIKTIFNPSLPLVLPKFQSILTEPDDNDTERSKDEPSINSLRGRLYQSLANSLRKQWYYQKAENIASEVWRKKTVADMGKDKKNSFRNFEEKVEKLMHEKSASISAQSKVKKLTMIILKKRVDGATEE